jgi:hypothetical protein
MCQKKNMRFLEYVNIPCESRLSQKARAVISAKRLKLSGLVLHVGGKLQCSNLKAPLIIYYWPARILDPRLLVDKVHMRDSWSRSSINACNAKCHRTKEARCKPAIINDALIMISYS